MPIARSLAGGRGQRLFGALSLLFLQFAGIGFLVCLPFLRGRREAVSMWIVFPLAVVCGIQANYAVALIVLELPLSLVIGAVLSVFGWGLFIYAQCSKGMIISYRCPWFLASGGGLLLAAYAGIAVVFAGRFAKSRDGLDALIAGSCFTLAAGIKNEGMLVAVAGLGVLLLIWCGTARWSGARMLWQLRMKWLACIPLLFMAMHPLLWIWRRAEWGIENILPIGSSEWFKVIQTNIADGTTFLHVVVVTLFQANVVGPAFLLLLLSWLMVARRWHRPVWESVAAMAMALLYSAGVIAVYMGIPNGDPPMGWWLGGAYRVMMTAMACIAAGAYGLIVAMEEMFLRGSPPPDR